MKHKSIAVALITVLLCMVLGNSIACTTPTTEYALTISSTEGGSVTTPGEGTYTYCENQGDEVNLVATPDAGYRFVNWTGDVGTIGNVNTAITTITINGDYSITANFALGTLIADVPDTNQPPTNTLPTPNPTNYCAPMAMVNILCYWDVVMGHSNAYNVTADLAANTTAEYLGYFMNTNDAGSPDRLTKGGGHAGTVDPDIDPGTLEFVRWDIANPPVAAPPFGLPAGKLGYDWTVTTNCTTDYNLSLAFYTAEIDAGRPLVVSFTYWNPVDLDIAVIDPETEETIDVFKWGDWVPWSYYPNPEEEWDGGLIGHAVTGVGYILDWDPDGAGPLGSADYVIVHDNWPTTPINVAIPWEHWICLHAVDPGPDGVPPAKCDLTISIGGFPCGSVTTPGVGTFTCDAGVGAVVNLVATPSGDCVFGGWTGDVVTIADVNAATTTITMNGDYAITAKFRDSSSDCGCG